MQGVNQVVSYKEQFNGPPSMVDVSPLKASSGLGRCVVLHRLMVREALMFSYDGSEIFLSLLDDLRLRWLLFRAGFFPPIRCPEGGVVIRIEVQAIGCPWSDHLNPAAFLPFMIFTISSLWIFSITISFKPSKEWSGRENCLATGFSILRCLMSNRWPVRQTRSAFSVSPTYWIAHRLHSIRYTTLLVPRSAVAFARNCAPVVELLNTVPVIIWAHAIQRGCSHGLFPLYVSLCCLNAALTKRSLRLRGRRYATRGHFGRATFRLGGYVNDALIIAENARQVEEIWMESDH